VEARLLESVFPTDTNPRGNLFGGTLVSWMDKAAGIAAMRRARNVVVTAKIEDIEFRVPIIIGDLVEVNATVESVGRTSLRVRVDVSKEDPLTGVSELCTTGNFTLVAIGPDRKPVPVDDPGAPTRG
jgi:acyl-CoA hydrolase